MNVCEINLEPLATVFRVGATSATGMGVVGPAGLRLGGGSCEGYV